MATNASFLENFTNLLEQGVPFVCVTMVDAVGSTPQDPGSRMLVLESGLHSGTVGGGRVEAKAIVEAQAMLDDPEAAPTRFADWNLQRDVGMTCGGVVRLFFEAYNHAEWNVAVFGAGHVCQALTRLLLTLPCRITVFDSRAEWLDRLPQAATLRRVEEANMASRVAELPANTFVLSMTMGHKLDRPILEEIFRSGRVFPYLGVIGSKSKAAVLRRELLDAGIPEEQVRSFHCPVGLPLGTNHPAEIAVSIAAQLLQVRDEWMKERLKSAKPLAAAKS
ncbi:MAG: xanthine dehydrogenase accessory factor [Candidatus Sumerlaeota bacterium]|nr:xanthine dehydrogenase accessory factor [Candidatus Sumerlaeota bacterium]